MVKGNADARAESLRNTICELQKQGRGTLGSIAQELNSQGILTARNATWHRSSVANLIKRLQTP
ncbi:recombinase family protein [Pseudoxanthomonas mexicana]